MFKIILINLFVKAFTKNKKKMLTALNKPWHVNCFKCNACSKNLNDESFLEIEENAYCKLVVFSNTFFVVVVVDDYNWILKINKRECYLNELAPQCKRCNNPITANFVSALDACWHPECFVCFVSIIWNLKNFRKNFKNF